MKRFLLWIISVALGVALLHAGMDIRFRAPRQLPKLFTFV